MARYFSFGTLNRKQQKTMASNWLIFIGFPLEARRWERNERKKKTNKRAQQMNIYRIWFMLSQSNIRMPKTAFFFSCALNVTALICLHSRTSNTSETFITFKILFFFWCIVHALTLSFRLHYFISFQKNCDVSVETPNDGCFHVEKYVFPTNDWWTLLTSNFRNKVNQKQNG